MSEQNRMANAVIAVKKDNMNNSEAVIQGGWGNTVAMKPTMQQ